MANNFLKVIESLKTYNDIRRGLPGIIAEIIFNKQLYKNNIDLKEFTDIFDNDYAEYLFKARPLLFARLTKELLEIENERELLIHKKKIEKFLLNKYANNKDMKQDKEKSKANNSTTKNIEAWGKFINPGRYNDI